MQRYGWDMVDPLADYHELGMIANMFGWFVREMVLSAGHWAHSTPAPIVATAPHCTPDRQTDRRSVCEPFQLLLYVRHGFVVVNGR